MTEILGHNLMTKLPLKKWREKPRHLEAALFFLPFCRFHLNFK